MDANQIELPVGTYKVKVMEATKGASQKGNPMITVDLEIVDSANITVKNPDTGENESVSPNGLAIRNWVTLVPQAIGAVNTFHRAFNLSTVKEADPNTYKGQVAYAVLKGAYKDMTDGAGQIMINPHTGKPVQTMERRVVKLLTP